MHKIGVIGLGNVGTTVAHILLMQGLADEEALLAKSAETIKEKTNE